MAEYICEHHLNVKKKKGEKSWHNNVKKWKKVKHVVSRPDVFLVAAAAPHVLDHLLALFGGETALLRDDLAEDQIHFAGHVGGVATDVECGLLLQEFADELGVFAQSVLDVHLLGRLTREGGDDLQGVAKLFLVGL